MSRANLGKLCSKKRSRGQAIYLSLVAIVFLSLMTFAAFNISQMTHAKSQTMNAADAGAYTMAVTVARDLNFMAYTNRAMVANHAVVGQLVSLASLSEMIYLAASDLSNLQYLAWVPYVGAIFEAIGSAFEYVATVIDEYVLPLLEDITEFQNGLIKGISKMQQVVHGATAFDMTKVETVIRANDPELRWAYSDGGGLLAAGSNIEASTKTFLGGFTEHRSDDTALSRMREVVNLSRDGFTIRREWVPGPGWPIKSSNLFHGGTQLSSDNKTWVGVDGFEMEMWRPWPKSNKWFRLWLTGEVAGSDGADDYRSLSHGKLTGTGHRRAYNNRKYRLEDTYDGLQAYQELTGDPKPGENATRSFVVLVYKPVKSADAGNDTRTANATQTFQTDASNPLHLNENRASIFGVAAAEVFFRRPARNDNDPTAGRLISTLYQNGTYATLFAPYWQPRLTDLPKGIAAALAVADTH